MDRVQEIQLEIYRRMLSIRQFELAVIDELKIGNIPGACHSSVGQEAAIVGACMALRDDDYITGTHRSHGHPIGKGAKLPPLMAELMGKATGVCKGRGGSMHLADYSVGIVGESAIVGGGLPLALGAALSSHIKGTDQVSLCFFGDGASNQGTFGETLNMAAIWQLPVIFFCENNLYAVTTSVAQSHGQPDVAKRAEGYGIPGTIVDGQDADAVYEVTARAVERARHGGGPTLIEAKTYRFHEHAVGLAIPLKYRADEELENYRQDRDPIKLYRAVLLDRGVEAKTLGTLEDNVSEAVSQALTFAQESPLPDARDAYDYLYSNPIRYPEQPWRKELR